MVYSQFGNILEGLGMENIGLFYSHLVLLRPFLCSMANSMYNIVAIWYIGIFGKLALHQEALRVKLIQPVAFQKFSFRKRVISEIIPSKVGFFIYKLIPF
jgi:hypothetical protein